MIFLVAGRDRSITPLAKRRAAPGNRRTARLRRTLEISLFDGKIQLRSRAAARTRVNISFLVKHLPDQFPRQKTGK